MGAGHVVGKRVRYHAVLDSTMDEARRLAEADEPEGTVVVAEEQTVGRGRFGRPWVSPPSQDLLFSVVLRPTSAQMPYVNMAATLAVSDAVADLTGLRPSIKWPNDVKVNGRKLSGILVETSVEAGEPKYAVVGIGLDVNLDTSQFPKIADIATSLYRETGRRQDRTKVLLAVLERLDDLYAAVRQGRSLTDRWAAEMETLGRTVQVRWGERVLEGRATGVDERGSLLLTRPDGDTVAVVAGEVTLQE